MEKNKLQYILIAILTPVFLLSVLYTRLKIPTAARIEHEFTEDKELDNIPKPQTAPEIRYEGVPKDPFKDLFVSYISKIKSRPPEPTETKEVKPLPQIAITGLVWNADIPQAVLNNKIVKIGDEIEGLKVLNIEKDGITVEYENEPVFISKTKPKLEDIKR